MSIPWLGLRNSACAEDSELCVAANVTSFSGRSQSSRNPLQPGFVLTTGSGRARSSIVVPDDERAAADEDDARERPRG